MFLFWIPFGSNALDQRSGDGRISGRSEVIAVNPRASIPKFEMLDAKIAFLKKLHPERQLHEMKTIWPSKRPNWTTRFLRARLIAFMIYEYFRVTGVHEAVLDYSDLFRIQCFTWRMFVKSIRDGTKSCYQSKQYPQTIFWKVCTRCAYVSLLNSKNVLGTVRTRI